MHPGIRASANYGVSMIERFKQVTDIYCHASCPDGTASALIAAKAAKILGINPKIHFIQYKTPEHDNLEPKPNQLFVDITPPLTRWADWADQGTIILDHHKTAEETVYALHGIFGGPTESGASLAFKHLLAPLQGHTIGHTSWIWTQSEMEQWQNFARLAAVRDTWQSNDPEWHRACAMAHGLIAMGSKLVVESVDTIDFEQIFQIGKLVIDKVERKAKVIAKSSHIQTEMINGQECKFIFFNLTDPTFSDLSEFLRKNHGFDITVSYFYIHDTNRACVSFRSNEKANVRIIAEKLNGGGHDRASGGYIPGLPSPNDIIERVMQAFKDS